MDVILTISLKITAKNQDKKTCFASYFADEVYRLCKAHNVYMCCGSNLIFGVNFFKPV